jgi:hypothetical protein
MTLTQAKANTVNTQEKNSQNPVSPVESYLKIIVRDDIVTPAKAMRLNTRS